MSSSVHVNNKNKNKNILVLSEALTADTEYPIDFTQSGKKIVLSLHYNGSNSFLYVDTVKMYQFKIKYSELKPYPFWWGNISKDFTIDKMKKAGLKQSVKPFSVEHDTIDTSNILNIYRCLIKKHGIK